MSAAPWSATRSPTCSPRLGFAVTREYYINDAGAQVEALARSAYLRYREALGEDIGAIPSGLYPGDYLKPVGEALKAEFGDRLLKQSEAEWMPLVRERVIAAMMEMIRADLDLLGIHHDLFFSERTLQTGNVDRVAEAISCAGREGPHLSGHVAAAEGTGAGGLGGP